MSAVLELPRPTGRIITTRLMGEPGHATFGWPATDDAWVLPLIERKLAEGYYFWLVEERPNREIRETRLLKVTDIKDRRRIKIEDAVARELFDQGKIGILPEGKPEMTAIRRATTAEEIARNSTVAHRRPGGG